MFGDRWESRLAEFLAFLRRRVTGDYTVDEYGFDPEVTERFLLAAIRPIAQKWFRIEVRGADNIPTEVDAYVLKEGALIDAFRYRMSQEANANRIEAAGFWRNESRAQETKWEQYIMEAARTDRGVDDVTFMLNYLGISGHGGYDIIDAHDEVWIRGRG